MRLLECDNALIALMGVDLNRVRGATKASRRDGEIVSDRREVRFLSLDNEANGTKALGEAFELPTEAAIIRAARESSSSPLGHLTGWAPTYRKAINGNGEHNGTKDAHPMDGPPTMGLPADKRLPLAVPRGASTHPLNSLNRRGSH